MGLNEDLKRAVESAVILPRVESVEDVHISLNYLNREPHFSSVASLAASGDYSAVARELERTANTDPMAKLLLGVVLVSFKADRLKEGIGHLEESLVGPPVLDPPAEEDFISLSFSDEAVLKFRINTLGGIALLAFAYAVNGDYQAAIDLTSEAYEVTEAEALLALQLWLLRDKERWDELIEAAEKGNPSDDGRFEIQLQRAVALSKVGREEDAFQAFHEISKWPRLLGASDEEYEFTAEELEATLPWIPAAAALADELDLSDETKDRILAPGDEESEMGQEYDVLRGTTMSVTPSPGGAQPTGPPRPSPSEYAVPWAEIDLSPAWRISTLIMPGGDRNVGRRLNWIAAFADSSRQDLSDAYDAELGVFSEEDSRHINFSNTDGRDVVSSALLSAMALKPGSASRLANVLNSHEYGQLLLEDAVESLELERPSVSSMVGDLAFGTARHPDSLVVALIANLCDSGHLEAAVEWTSWLTESTSDRFGNCIAASLSYAVNDDQSVLSLTEDAQGEHGVREVLDFYRARSLMRMSSYGAAKVILDRLVRETSRSDPADGTALATRYLRSRWHTQNGKVAAALGDLDAIQAVQFDYLDVIYQRALLEGSSEGAQTQRTHIPKEIRYEVFRRDGGRCTECGTDFDLQFDHIIPVAMGGSSSAANLQLLCGECNRSKAATLG